MLLHTFGDDEIPYLLVGLADGSLVAYELAFVSMVVGEGREEVSVHVKSKRTLALGNLPLRLTACRYGKEGRRRVVFVSGSRPAILFLENKRLQHSPLDVKVRLLHILSLAIATSCSTTACRVFLLPVCLAQRHIPTR